MPKNYKLKTTKKIFVFIPKYLKYKYVSCSTMMMIFNRPVSNS